MIISDNEPWPSSVGGDELAQVLVDLGRREAEALASVEHPHIVPLRDVAADGGPVLVRPLLQRTLADWLVARGRPERGEVVTALAPVAAAVGALHAIGARAGALAAGAVRIDADGAPLIMAEGAAIETDRPTQAWRQASEGVADDSRPTWAGRRRGPSGGTEDPHPAQGL